MTDGGAAMTCAELVKSLQGQADYWKRREVSELGCNEKDACAFFQRVLRLAAERLEQIEVEAERVREQNRSAAVATERAICGGDLIDMGNRRVRICGPVGMIANLDHRSRIAVRNADTNRLSYIKERQLKAGRQIDEASGK